MAFTRHIFVPSKKDYIKGNKKPNVDCILCAIIRRDPAVTQLMVWEDELFGICVNLYPYNAGHILIFPKRHVLDLRELTDDEEKQYFRLLKTSLNILDKLYQPGGYNIGFNIGEASGASVAHLHQHIVPRYHKELGFVDIINGSKIIIEDPQTTMQRLKDAFDSYK